MDSLLTRKLSLSDLIIIGSVLILLSFIGALIGPLIFTEAEEPIAVVLSAGFFIGVFLLLVGLLLWLAERLKFGVKKLRNLRDASKNPVQVRPKIVLLALAFLLLIGIWYFWWYLGDKRVRARCWDSSVNSYTGEENIKSYNRCLIENGLPFSDIVR